MLKFNNLYWQVLETEEVTLYLYAAYYDNRDNNKLGSSVRIIGMKKKSRMMKDDLFCHFWSDPNSKAIKSPVVSIDYTVSSSLCNI